MVVTWLIWLAAIGLAMGVGIIAVDWIWKPMRLIQRFQEQGIHGFSFIPFVGQMQAIDKVLKGRFEGEQDGEQAISGLWKLNEKHGKIFYFSVGKTVRLSISDPLLIKDILQSNADCYGKPLHVRILGILGDGLFASSGDTWAPQRQLFHPPFHTKEIKRKLPVIIECAIAATERWAVEVSAASKELDMYQLFLELTLDVIGRTVFGAEIGGASRSAAKVIGGFDRYLHNCRELVFGPAAAIPGYQYFPTRINKEISQDKHWLSSFTGHIISNRQESLKWIRLNDEASPYSEDLLDLMISAAHGANSEVPIEKVTSRSKHRTPVARGVHDGQNEGSSQLAQETKGKVTNALKGLTKGQLMDNSLTFLLAGHETTASLLTWTIYLLAKHPLWQERARSEVEEFCQEGLEWKTLNNLKTISMILNESMRLFPPAPLIGRTCLKENVVGPTTIPNGVDVMIPVAAVHRDRQVWGDNADEFWPARFANGISGACGNPSAFIPFGAGPRTCIGQTLALTESRVILAVMLPMFSWKLSPIYCHSPDITLTSQPRFGMPIVLETLR